MDDEEKVEILKKRLGVTPPKVIAISTAVLNDLISTAFELSGALSTTASAIYNGVEDTVIFGEEMKDFANIRRERLSQILARLD